MGRDERLVEFKLLGQEFSFYTEATEEEMSKILSIVREVVGDDVHKMSNTLTIGKVAVLGSLNLASRYVKLEKDFACYRQGVEVRASKIIDKIEDGLEMVEEKKII